MDSVAFQDRIEDNLCFGCGAANERGLQIKSFWEADGTSVCTFRPLPHHAAGPAQFLNGGIIATVIDCHCICTAIANVYRSEGREIGSEPSVWCVTASINVTYLQPTPIGDPVELRARIVEVGARKTVLTCSLCSGEQECARAEVIAVRVPPGWSAADPA